MSSRFPGRGFVARRVTSGVAEQGALFSPAGPEASALTVTQAVAQLNGLLRSGMSGVWIRGEVADFKGPAASGHAYFCLKDKAATLRVKMWATEFARVPF